MPLSQEAALSWSTWTSSPGWATGYLVARWVNWTTISYRYLMMATMVAGWTDDGTWLGAPAQPDKQAKRQLIAIQHLPELLRRVNKLERKLGVNESPSTLGEPGPLL